MNTIEQLRDQVKELRRQKHKLQMRIRYYNNIEKEKERLKKYRETNKEKEKERIKKYNQTEKGKEKKKMWILNNQEKDKKSKKKYSKSENGYKSTMISKWKYKGLIDNYKKVYERYEYTLFCDECRCDLDQCTKSVKTMDHDHTTGLFRNILCRSCNIKRG
jgi:hypothetical protein